VSPDPGHSLGKLDRPCGGGCAAGDRRTAPSSHVGGCYAGDACLSKVAVEVAGGPTVEDACDALPHPMEAAPRRWSGGWASEPACQPPPVAVAVGRRGRTGSHLR
jgi:hypothetical protein